MFKRLQFFLLMLSLMPSSISYGESNFSSDIGTTAIASMSFTKEKQLGDLYTRQLTSAAPLSSDPIALNYLNALGDRLASHTSINKNIQFDFHIVNSNTVNAFAYFGGHVVVNSRLVLTTENESELASVLTHEMGHITQRHLARQIEDNKSTNPLAWGGILGGVLVSALNPQAGMAIATSSMAGATQSKLSFSQSNEVEADRVGFQLLVASGFDPEASAAFLQKLDDQSRFSNEKVFAILATHPNPGSRVADMKNRAHQYSKKNIPSSLDYYLFKSRLAMNQVGNNQKVYLNNLSKGVSEFEKEAYQYAFALYSLNQKEYTKAENILAPLLNQSPDNLWYLDLMSDIYINLGQIDNAITLLNNALKTQPNQPVLQLNLANAYLSNKQYSNAISILQRYTISHPNDLNGWDLLVKSYNGIQHRAQAIMAQAEIYALNGNIPTAIKLLQGNLNLANEDPLTRSKMEAKIDQLKELDQQFRNLI